MHSEKEVKGFINNVLQSDDLITNDDLLDFTRLLSGGRPFKNFLMTVKSYDTHTECSNTWESGEDAYRCETCSHLSVMAMCKECFEPERHEGHKYYLFPSFAPGKCDCGNADVMDASGFCHRSGFLKECTPPELIYPAVQLIPPFISKMLHLIVGHTAKSSHSLLSWIRHRYYAIDSGRKTDVRKAIMLSILEDLSKSSDTMRGIICDALTDPKYYDPRIEKVYCPELEKIYKTSISRTTSPFLVGLERVYKRANIPRNCMLDSLFVWTIQRGLHKRIWHWFLSLASDRRVKKKLAEAYVKSYGYLVTIMERLDVGLKYADTMAPLTLEIFSCPSIALSLVKDFQLMKKILHLLQIYFLTFYGEAPYHIQIYGTLFDRDPPYLDFTTKFKNSNPYLYQQANDDFISLFNHRLVVYEFLFDPTEKDFWLSLVNYFQGMHPLIFNAYFGFDEADDAIMRAFTVQVEICIHPMWTMLHHFRDITQEIIGMRLFHPVLLALLNWVLNHELNFHVVFYHIPLHRIFSLILFSEMMVGSLKENDVQIDEEFLKRLVHSPIRLWAASAEQVVYKWPRNSSSVRTYCKLYKYATFFCSTVDPDIFFIQFACSQLDPDFFVQFTLENFDTMELLCECFGSDSHVGRQLYMLDEVLFYFAILTNARVLSGKSDKEVFREEIINMLSKKALTHTQFLEELPYRGFTPNKRWAGDADNILQEVAYLERETMGTRNEPLPGQYHIKTDVLIHEYDPVMVRMRSVNSDDFDNALNLYKKRLQKEKLTDSQDSIWPPFRKPIHNHHPYLTGYTNFLNSPSLHGLLFVILYKCLIKMRLSALQITIHLLNMALKFPYVQKFESYGFPYYNDLYRNCLLPFDYQINVLVNFGLFHLFDDVNGYIPPTHPDERRNQFGFDPNIEVLYAFNEGPKLYRDVDPSERSSETILSLLLKLFKELTKKIYIPLHMRGEGAVRYGSPESSGERIGGAEYFIGEVLDQLVDGSEEVLKFVEEYVAQESQNQGEEEDEEDKKAQIKKKAQAKKAQLMKKMAKKSKKFLKTVEPEDLVEEIEDTSVKCIECDQPMVHDVPDWCVMVYITRTTMLGHRVSEPHPTLSYIRENTFQHNFKELHLFKKNMFPDNSLPIEWYDNLWIQSCNHPIHFRCYFTHMNRTITDEERRLPGSERRPWHEREIWCPYCRQLANFILPLAPQINYVQRFATPDHHLIIKLINRDLKINVAKMMKFIENHISKWKFLHGNYAMEYINIYRNNIELYLMEKRVLTSQEETTSLTFTSTKKVHVNAVHNYCSILAKKRIRKEDLYDLFAIHPEPEAESEKTFNFALVDIKQLLAKTAILIPTKRKDLTGSVICFYINLYMLQLLSWLVFCTKKGELIEVIHEYNMAGTQLEYILNFMADFFHQPKTLKTIEEPFMELFEARMKDFLMFCHTVFASVCHFDDEYIRDLQDYDAYELYAFFFPDFQNNPISSIQCFGWSDELLNMYMEKFCYHTNFILQIASGFLMAGKLMLLDWRPACLVALPPKFSQFYEHIKSSFPAKGISMQQCSMCLICGEVCFLGGWKNNRHILMEHANYHTEKCGRGTGIYLKAINELVIIWGRRVITYTSPYINVHGEDFPSFDKPNDLTLSEDRLKMVERMWRLNYFDYFCRNWNNVLP